MIKYKKYIYLAISILVCTLLFTVYYCKQQHDLPQIVQRGKIRVVTCDSINNFEYEILQCYAKTLAIKIEILKKKDLNSALQMLNDHKAELLLRLLPTTKAMQQMVLLTSPIAKTQLLLIQNNKDEMIKIGYELENETITVEKNSPYLTRLHNIQEELGLKNLVINEVEASPKELLQQLTNNEIPFTIYDRFSLHLLPKNRDINYQTISVHHFLAWGIAQSCPKLHDDLNRYLKTFVNTVEYRDLLRKYYY